MLRSAARLTSPAAAVLRRELLLAACSSVPFLSAIGCTRAPPGLKGPPLAPALSLLGSLYLNPPRPQLPARS